MNHLFIGGPLHGKTRWTTAHTVKTVKPVPLSQWDVESSSLDARPRAAWTITYCQMRVGDPMTGFTRRFFYDTRLNPEEAEGQLKEHLLRAWING